MVAHCVHLKAFASDRDRMARFSREAQVLASLNHPHIASIYGLEDSNDKQALAVSSASTILTPSSDCHRASNDGTPSWEATQV